MKIHKSRYRRPIDKLPKSKVTITIDGEDLESVWVAIDRKNNVMYLLNNALCFYPIPSWGMELPYTIGYIDLYSYRGESTDDTEFTVCREAYEGLKKFINKDDEFNYREYLVI